jgi:hypothetical protein
MKSKNIKKITKELYRQIRLEKEEQVKAKNDYIDGDWCEYDSEVSDKFKKMFLQIIDYKDNLRINISDSNISVYIQDVKNLKSKSKLKSNSDDDCLEILITKDRGYSLVKGYNKRSQFKDKDIFNQLEGIVKDRLSILNRENFNDIWENIMLESGLIRDNNLLDILKEE